VAGACVRPPDCEFLYYDKLFASKNRILRVILNIYNGLCISDININCSFYVKYSTGLHEFVGILAKKLAPFLEDILHSIIIEVVPRDL